MDFHKALKNWTVSCLLAFMFLFISKGVFAESFQQPKFKILEQSGEQPRRAYQDLFVQFEGREYLITDEYLHVHPFKSINQLIDLDGDGVDEVILQIAHGGNCCGPGFVIVSFRDKLFYSIAKHYYLDGKRFPELSITKSNDRPLIKVRSISGAASEDMAETMTVLEFNEGELFEITSVENAALLPAIIEINSTDFISSELEPISKSFNADNDTAADSLSCTLWLRWNDVSCEVLSTKFGRIEIPIACKRIGVLETLTMGVKDLVCGRSKILTFNGEAYN